MTVTETVQETVQSVTGAAQHAVGEAKALLPQIELPCKYKSNYDPFHTLRSGQNCFAICTVVRLDFDMANETLVQLHLHHEKQCPKRGYPFSIETAALTS